MRTLMKKLTLDGWAILWSLASFAFDIVTEYCTAGRNVRSEFMLLLIQVDGGMPVETVSENGPSNVIAAT